MKNRASCATKKTRRNVADKIVRHFNDPPIGRVRAEVCKEFRSVLVITNPTFLGETKAALFNFSQLLKSVKIVDRDSFTARADNPAFIPIRQ